MPGLALDELMKRSAQAGQSVGIEAPGGNLVAQSFEHGAGGLGDGGAAVERGQRLDRFGAQQLIHRGQQAVECGLVGGGHSGEFARWAAVSASGGMLPTSLQRVRVA